MPKKKRRGKEKEFKGSFQRRLKYLLSRGIVAIHILIAIERVISKGQRQVNYHVLLDIDRIITCGQRIVRFLDLVLVDIVLAHIEDDQQIERMIDS